MYAIEMKTEEQQADELVTAWYRWAMSWRPHLGCPKTVPYCRQSKTSRQYDEDAGYEEYLKLEMAAVECCVDKLPQALQMAIKTEMKNREVSARIWRDRWGASYKSVLRAVVPGLKEKGLIR